MNEAEAKLLMQSFLGRLRREEELYWQLPDGRMSGSEREALAYLCSSDQVGETLEAKTVKSLPPIAINRAAFTRNGPPERLLRMCLDFGTAMSKAWATGRNSRETIPLVLGAVAGSGNTFAVPSSVYIANNGRIYLGQDAILQHRSDLQRDRFDNLKRLLSEEPVGSDLQSVPLSRGINPTDVQLSRGDVLILYLAWLTDLAERALKRSIEPISRQLGVEKYDLRATIRRFAIPCFGGIEDKRGEVGRAAWAEEIMKEALLKAQVVADSIGSQWSSLTARRYSELIRSIDSINTAPLAKLIAVQPDVREPIAAGASRFEAAFEPIDEPASKPVRRLLMVIDSGAGTTDFAVFQVVTPQGKIDPKYSLLKQTVKMSRIAGNEIDEILRPLILRACEINPDNGQPRSKDDFDYIRADLASQIRDLKLALIRNGKVQIDLRPNASGTLDVKTLFEADRWKKDKRELSMLRDSIVAGLFSKNQLEEIEKHQSSQGVPYLIHVLLTGGSSRVPMIQHLAQGEATVGKVRFKFALVDDLPTWIAELPTDIAQQISEVYPECAVAIGGSARELPPELSDMDSAIGPAPKRMPKFTKKISDA